MILDPPSPSLTRLRKGAASQNDDNMENDFKYKDIHWEKADPKEIIFPLISPGSKVLDLGCWAGRLGEKLIKEKNCEVYGVDINKKAIELAKKRLSKAFLIDLNKEKELPKLFNNEKFDYIVLVEVLEHLINPEKLLIKVKKLLKNDGKILISVPNIANWEIRLKLLFGSFDYEEQGILDETHLRFFTRKSIQHLLISLGFNIEQEYYTRAIILPGLFATQFIYVCTFK